MKAQQKMFKNPVLEFLSLSGPKMMTVYHVLVAGGLLTYGFIHFYNGELTQVIGWFALGYLSWTLAEYLLHRFLFHWINDLKWVQKFHYAMHGYHHSVPHDHNRLFMPPAPATLFMLAFLGIFYLVMGNQVWFFLPGFELGYLTYAMCHYLVHTNPKSKWIASLGHHHILHHYKFPDKAFGVSTRFWDRVFGTMPPKLEKKSS